VEERALAESRPLMVEETAEVLGVAPITVMREWRNAKAWLYHELTSKGDGG